MPRSRHALASVFAAVLIAAAGSARSADECTLLPAAREYEAVGAARTADAADLNGDGHPDLVSLTWSAVGNAPNIRAKGLGVLFNDGRGGFGVPVVYEHEGSEQDFPNDVAIADLDGDGDLDIVAGGRYRGLASSRSRLYINDGAGVFTVSELGIETLGEQIVAADIDADGDADLVFSGSRFEPGVYLNDGAASFTPSGVATGYSERVAVADMNGDGLPDLITGDFREVVVVLATAPGVFDSNAASVLGAEEFAVADFSGDGVPDIALADNDTIGVAINDGVGGFTEPGLGELVPGGVETTMHAGDLDGDGDLDLISPDVAGLYTVLNQGDGTLAAGRSIPNRLGTGRLEPALADLDGDGDPDLIHSMHNTGTLQVVLNPGDGDLAWGDRRAFGDAGDFRPGERFEAADFDRDGDADLMLWIPGVSVDGTLTQYRRAPDGSFTEGPAIPFATEPGSFEAVDLNADGAPDVVVVEDGVLRAYLNDGSGGLTLSHESAPLGASYDTRIADADGDGDVDALLLDRNGGRVGLAFGDGLGGFGAVAWQDTGFAYASDALVFDTDGDGKADIVAVADGALHRFSYGPGGALATEHIAGTNAHELLAADLDGDGDREIVELSRRWNLFGATGGERVRYATGVRPLMNAGGVFVPGEEQLVEAEILSARAEDLDGDGVDELCDVEFETHTITVLRSLGDGTFAEPDRVPTPEQNFAFDVADMNGDGAADFVSLAMVDVDRDSTEPSVIQNYGTPCRSPCNPADLARPFGVLDLADITGFVAAFAAMDDAADLAGPAGVFDLSDIVAFVEAFGAGCP